MPLVTSKEMFEKAYNGGYAIGAFNVNNMEIVQGITEACQEEHAPVILQVSKGARAYANHTYLVKLVEAAVECCPDIPIVLHLDHGPDFETCKSCIDGGFTSVMIDASSKPFAENIEITKRVVEYAHDHGVVVEAELGTLAGIEDEVKVAAHEASYTRPEEVEEFVSKTGCDSLAIAIGTCHGAYKFKPEQCTRNEKGILVPPPLRFDVLEEVSRRLPGFPIVLHGSSSVPQEYVKMINDHGGRMPNAIGVPEEQLREAAKLSVWVYADEKGVQVFALYGIGDGTDATPLYAVGGKRAKQIADDLRMMEDAYEKTDGGRGAVDSWIESIRRAKGSRNGNRSTDGNGRTAVQNDGLHGGSSGSDGSGAAERSSENQRGVKDQFSIREPVEETRDLLALHNMTAANLRGALEPVRQPKEFSKFGNGALQQLVSEVGVQELARINAQRQERLAVLDNVHSG